MSGKKDVWVYDTGASNNSMTRDFFNKLPKYSYKKLYRTKGKKSTYYVQQSDGSYVDIEYYLIEKITIRCRSLQCCVWCIKKEDLI